MTKATRANRRRHAAARAAAHAARQNRDEPREFTVHVAPWGETESFPTRRKAKKFARRNRRQIAANWDY